ITANFLAFGAVKPRFGRRRYSGIWPPSYPFRATPERDFWPLMPRPAVLPLPEPGPRATRFFVRFAPSLSRISCSFISLLLGRTHPRSETGRTRRFLIAESALTAIAGQ